MDAWWDHVDPVFEPLFRLAAPRARFMASRLDFAEKDAIDVGCGGGFMSEAVTRKGARVTGVDIAPGALTAARDHAHESGLDIRYVQAPAHALPFESGSFDVAICTDVLVHLPDPSAAVAEIGRVLKPGGRFFFSTINRNRLSRLIMVTLAEDVLGVIHHGTHDANTFIRPDEMRQACGAAAMNVTELQGLGPVGWWRTMRFGWHPTLAVMYQGVATKNGVKTTF